MTFKMSIKKEIDVKKMALKKKAYTIKHSQTNEKL